MNGSINGPKAHQPNGLSPVFKEAEIGISVDLVQAAKWQLAFLKEVDKYPCLYSGYSVKNAILRYERYWLPLAAENDGKDICPPLDVHWIWHVHMLAPYFYEKDCTAIVGKVIPHKLRTESARHSAMENAAVLWAAKFNDEPFHLRLDDYSKFEKMSNGCHNVNQDDKSKITYNLENAVARQRMFYYQVSLPHYQDTQFLRNAVLRYKKYLFLKKINKELFLVPCYDFDLVWHSHQIHPLIYKKDTVKILGRMFNHDDSVNDRAPDSKLSMSDTQTRDLWKKFFNEDFAICGAMYRGEPPNGKLHTLTSDQLMSICSKVADVTVQCMSIENLSLDEQKYSLEVSLVAKGDAPLLSLFKLKGPQRVWEGNGKGVAKFTFDTKAHTAIEVSLIDKKGFMCFSSNQAFGVGRMLFASLVENTPPAGQVVKQTIQLTESSAGPANRIDVEFSASIQAPRQGPCALTLQAGPFQTYTMPENIEQMWGPIPLMKLPDGVPNTCIVASHR